MKPRQTYLFDEAAPMFGPRPLILDYFAGGGGVSSGILAALGRSPDVAINHCDHALAMHALNHPTTEHFRADVWDVDPRRHLPPGPVDLVWLSPDCKHFSRAKGGKPVSKKIRGLAWVAVKVAARRRPRVLILENVAEFRTWGPVRDGQPVKSKAGSTYRRFLSQLRGLGYEVEDRILNAADYGAPTLRKRLILIARCDGAPIVWPEPTHGPGRSRPYRTAAGCIDWSLPCPSIFGRKRPLAEATQRRIAEGLRRYVFETSKPFLVQVNHGRDVNRSRAADEPMPTITAKHGFALVSPSLVQMGYGERAGQAPRALNLHAPLGTVVAGGAKHALVVAWLAKHYGGVVGHQPTRPLGTVTARDHHSVVQGQLEPVGTTVEGRAREVAAFVIKYYGQGGAQPLSEPLHTIVSRARFGLVSVELDGETYALVDIGLRMLSPRELARCQGFGDDYQMMGTQAEQVARIGNSVCPPLAEAIVRANLNPHTSAVPQAAE